MRVRLNNNHPGTLYNDLEGYDIYKAEGHYIKIRLSLRNMGAASSLLLLMHTHFTETR